MADDLAYWKGRTWKALCLLYDFCPGDFTAKDQLIKEKTKCPGKIFKPTWFPSSTRETYLYFYFLQTYPLHTFKVGIYQKCEERLHVNSGAKATEFSHSISCSFRAGAKEFLLVFFCLQGFSLHKTVSVTFSLPQMMRF